MKINKTTMFFAALTALTFTGASAQTQEEIQYYTKDYNHEKLHKMSVEMTKKYEQEIEEAKVIAAEKGLPMSGMTPDGRFYEVVGLNEDRSLKIYSTSNNTPINSSNQTTRAQYLHLGGSLGLNVNGQGISLGEWDGGAVRASHSALGVTRVTQMDNGANATQGEEGPNHATHVAGTMIANQASGNLMGIAPEASLKAHNWTDDLGEMTARAAAGMLVSNHSYGANYGYAGFHNNPQPLGRYDATASYLDGLLVDTPYYLPVYAAGNDRNGGYSATGSYVQFNTAKGGYDLLHGSAVAKNPVVVAAIGGFTEYTSAADAVMSPFSNWGPTDDFRIKPDISSKGVDVLSCIATSDDATDTYSGTSMAAPSVTAVFGLWQQYYGQLFPFNMKMRAATLKALMAHTASEAGDSEGPDPKFGWGVIDAKKGAEVMKQAKDGTGSEILELTLNGGQVYEKTIQVDGTSVLTATIAWYDPASAAKTGEDNTSPALVNDLDLRIIRPNGVEIFPYALNKNWSNIYASQQDNDVDVIEKVVYKSAFTGTAPAGTYTIRVSHKGQGLVNTNQNQSLNTQQYSLVISGVASNTSVEEKYFDELSIYPNPADDYLFVEASVEKIIGAKVKIFDLTGKKVMDNAGLFEYNSAATIDISSLRSGVYLLQLENNGHKQTKKIIKK